MKVTIFGATGKTGSYLIEEALKRGIEVTVFARSSSPFTHPKVRIIRGDLTDKKSLMEAIRGADAVLSALGPTSLKHPKDLPITQALKAIISVMQQEGLKRLITISTGTAVDPGDGFDLKIWLPALLVKLMLPASYDDIIESVKVIRESNLDWTLVRAAVLKNRPASKKLNLGLYGHTKHSLTVSREEIAAFMFDQISSRDFVRQAPGISSQ
ncbi:SDR family oxidoreductase [Paenibacillus sp. LjRoot153]|uniref:NAD(P)-dependent oxidoreductase n=1 Tax=Paenibacillus sp. LjRoot153 TaxID=3342270 RepID=UPI003ECEA0C2